jgi:hypothetical protein
MRDTTLVTTSLEDELRLPTPAQAAETLAISRKTLDGLVEAAGFGQSAGDGRPNGASPPADLFPLTGCVPVCHTWKRRGGPPRR